MNNNFQGDNQGGNQYQPYTNAPQKSKGNGVLIAIAVLAAVFAFLIGIGVGGFIVYKVTFTKQVSQVEADGPTAYFTAEEVTDSGETSNVEHDEEEVADSEETPYIEPETEVANDDGLTIDSVDWDEPEAASPGQEKHYEITVHLSDGSIRTTYLDTLSIEGVEYADFDNDGKDEFVICSYFANTGGEFFEKNVYKLKDDEVISIFPNSDIYELTDVPIDAKIITVTVDGEERYGLETVTLEKEDGMSYISYHAKIYYNVDHWEVAEMIDDSEG